MRVIPDSPAPTTPALKRLREAAHQLEGVFLAQMFRAMRDAVPADTSAGGDSGREMFTSMLDDKLAETAADRMHNGLGDALYRQLSRRLTAATETSVAEPASKPGAVRADG